MDIPKIPSQFQTKSSNSSTNGDNFTDKTIGPIEARIGHQNTLSSIEEKNRSASNATINNNSSYNWHLLSLLRKGEEFAHTSLHLG